MSESATVSVKMVEISEAELIKLRGELSLSQARIRELEAALRREMSDHQQEYNELLKRVSGAAS